LRDVAVPIADIDAQILFNAVRLELALIHYVQTLVVELRVVGKPIHIKAVHAVLLLERFLLAQIVVLVSQHVGLCAQTLLLK